MANMERIAQPEPVTGSRIKLWLVSVLLVVLYAPTAAWLWERWTLSVWHHAHGFLILVIVCYLIFKKLRELQSLPVSSSVWGFLLLVPALILYALDAGMHTQLLAAVAMFLTLPGLSLLFLGRQRTKEIIIPLVFLLFTLPIPLAFTEQLHLVLRQIATVGTAFIIPKLGIPLYVEGTTLHIPGGTLLVADACSGFSTLYAALAVACLVAYTCPVMYRRILVLLIAAPLAIAVNVIRVTLLVLLVHQQGIDVLSTSWHTISGLFTFALSLPIIFMIGYVPEKNGKRS